MAPPRGGGRRSTQTSEHIYKLGERGRKTGVTLRDTGVRDEHGMEPIDNIFSSPGKGNSDDGDEEAEDDEEEGEEADDDDDDDDDENGEAPMDLTTGSGLDPAAMINGQGAYGRRSPGNTRTLFGSPAVRGSASKKAIRQKPVLEPPSSPSAGAIHQNSSPSKPVKRRLDYGKSANANASANAQRRPFALPPPNGIRRQQFGNDEEEEEEEEEDEAEESNVLHSGGHIDEESMQMVADDAPEEDDLPVRPAAQVKRRAGRPPGKGKSPAGAKSPAASKTLPPGPQQIPSSVPKGKRGRPAASASTAAAAEDDSQTAKRRRVAEPEAAKEEPKAKGRRGRPAAAAKAAPEPAIEEEPEQPEQPEQPEEPAEDAAPKKRGRKRKSSGVGAATAAAAAVPRGPPLPKSRGLVVRRREVEEGGDSLVKTRSGRSSFRPLAFWRNEHVEFDPTDVQQDGFAATSSRSKFLLPTIKDIVRVDDEVLRGYGQGGRRGRGGGGGGAPAKRGRKRRQSSGDGGDVGDDEPDRDPWEANPGKVSGDIVVWYPEHELEPPALGQNVEMTSAEIALSNAAIQTHDVRGGTFKFVKTLSLPFFGTGMVDMPPGSEKRLKNSRKMHMTFFVHYGQVLVKVNESEFRIAKGGMWSVPRGNYYSITNDKDYPARCFFAQGCEILAPLEVDDDGQGNE